MSDQIVKRFTEINAMPVGSDLPAFRDMPGFAEWLAHPVTVELLARAASKADAARVALAKYDPDPSAQPTRRGWVKGCHDALASVVTLCVNDPGRVLVLELETRIHEEGRTPSVPDAAPLSFGP
jgi:hypothetical protein